MLHFDLVRFFCGPTGSPRRQQCIIKHLRVGGIPTIPHPGFKMTASVAILARNVPPLQLGRMEGS